MGRLVFFLTISLLVILFYCLRYTNTNGTFSSASASFPPNDIRHCDQQRLILTDLGLKSYAELEKEVFNPFGYAIALNCTPFPVLKYMKPMICNTVFEEWIRIVDDADPNAIPKKTIPEDQMQKYLLNGVSLLSVWYSNDRSLADSKVDLKWTMESINELMQRPDGFMISYGKVATSVQTAFNDYRNRITGKRCLVIGSIYPWVEVLALQSGAKSVTTAEYRKIVMGHSSFAYLHPVELAQNWINYIDKFDFIASFSSIEHSGLGRYGDPADPVGDLREMQKLWCLLRPGQLLFIGFPVGRDEVAYNAHRIYGAVRLAMMFTGWRLLNVYFADYKQPYSLNVTDLEGFRVWDRQMLFVLER